MSCFKKVAIELTMSCIIYIVNWNFVIHVTCLLTFMTYKYNDLQVVARPIAKHPFFS
jgi:hypothetical protein